MARYIVRRLGFMLLTMLMVSMAVFLISEAAPGDVARHILGQFATQEQVELLRDQMGLNQPLFRRYLDWLIGNDWRLQKYVGMPLVQAPVSERGEVGWFAQAEDGTLKQWRMKKEGLFEIQIAPDGSRQEIPFDDWQVDEEGREFFWGVDTANHVVLWEKGVQRELGAAAAGRAMTEGSGLEYHPIKRGLIRGDPGISHRTNRPVGPTLVRRVRNSLTLAAIAFVLIMPIAVVMGIVAGIREGSAVDRTVSVLSLITTSIPEFATGVLLILIFAFWLKLLPGLFV